MHIHTPIVAVLSSEFEFGLAEPAWIGVTCYTGFPYVGNTGNEWVSLLAATMGRPMSQMYFVLTSLTAIVAGMNFILFFFCIYVLWGQKTSSRKFILLSAILQFSLSVALAALYIRYLVVAFELPAADAEFFFQRVSGYSLACYIIFIVNYTIEGILLIWRIYKVYGNNVKFCIPSIILLLFQLGFGGVTAKAYATQAIIMGRLHTYNMVTLGFIAAVNVSATILICLRLWIAHRRAYILSLSKYKSTIIVVVECGALITISTVAILILYTAKHPMGLASLGVTTQVATLAPLLIVARHGILNRQDVNRSLSSLIPLRISDGRTQDKHVSTSVGSTQTKCAGSLSQATKDVC